MSDLDSMFMFQKSTASLDDIHRSRQEFRIATGSADYSVKELEEVNNWATGKKTDLQKAIDWWRKDPIVYRCVDLLAKFSNSRMTIQCENESTSRIIKVFANKAADTSFRKSFFTEYFRTGFVNTIKTLVDYKPRDFKRGKIPKPKKGGNISTTASLVEKTRRAREEFEAAQSEYKLALASNYDAESIERVNKAMLAKEWRWRKLQVPGKYMVLSPTSVDIKGPSQMPWLWLPFLKIDDDFRSVVDGPEGVIQKLAVESLPSEMSNAIKSGAKEVWLSPNIHSMIVGDQIPGEKYPVPICQHAFHSLDHKYSLIDMDKATAKNLRERILKVTVGNDEYPAEDEDIAKVHKLFEGRTTRNMVLFWNHTLEIEWIEPKTDILQDADKYEYWDKQIRAAFGMSEIIMGVSDKGGSTNTMIALKSVDEMVREAQDKFTEWFNKEIELIKMSLGLSGDVKVKFERINLKDENKFMSLMLQFVLNGIIDEETAIEYLNLDYPTITARFKKLMKLKKEEGLFLPRPSANNMGPEDGIPTGGKPSDQNNDDNNENKQGKSQVKNATARLVLRGEDVHLVVKEDVDSQMVVDLAEEFDLPRENVVSAKAYKEIYGESVSFNRPLPALSTTEMVAASSKATSNLADFQARVAERVKAQGGYVTEGKTRKAQSDLISEYLRALRPDHVEEEVWEEALASCESKESDPHARVMLGSIVAAQFRKQHNERRVV